MSVSALLRELVARALTSGTDQPRPDDFTFIGAGRSRQGKLKPVSERHDEALAEALAD